MTQLIARVFVCYMGKRTCSSFSVLKWLNEDRDPQISRRVVAATVVTLQYLKTGMNTGHMWDDCSWWACRHQPFDSQGL